MARVPFTQISKVYKEYRIYSRKLSRVKTFANFAVLPPSAKVLSEKIFARGLGERVGGVNHTRAQGRSSFATRVRRVPLKIQQSHGSVQVAKQILGVVPAAAHLSAHLRDRLQALALCACVW